MPRVSLDFPQSVVYSHVVRLRISDINYGQHLGHDTLVSLLHDARCGWLRQAQLSELSIGGDHIGWVVAELVVNYKAEAFYGDELHIELAVGEIGSKGAEIFHRVVSQAGAVVGVAKVGVVFFDFATRQAVAVPQAFLQLAGRV
ncbi:MAG: acyl-CoA thioesterase [Marinospirillum sp.]|uniref:acyl-CoA thioesterase n=1 Tax=Marinospirillum sp. TaxID=2183934 RepID=UPI0019F3D347|nr:acyl-CoA thioesterase [Marinospirillum sp.]MBE0506022.1 acyl-CoA thioesterase [Marinospirillum sp.]